MFKFVPLSFFLVLLHQTQGQGNFNECQLQEESCSACISYRPECAWCEDVIYTTAGKDGRPIYLAKCDTRENHAAQKCNNVTYPESEFINTKNEELKNKTRVSPQEVKIKLRPGQPVEIPIKVQIPINFPIDLYYLMDLSKSMLDDLAQIQELGKILGKELKQITEQFRLGFGGFVDKPVGPYTKTLPKEIEGILQNIDAKKKEYTYAYKNHLPLNEDIDAFRSTIAGLNISFNVDSPECSLEALTQVITCQNSIGWRNKNEARRIVIVTTDALFHYSGDGLLGGFPKPNDGQCHMVNNVYNAWDKYDYPSLSQVRELMLDNDMVPIFATTGNEDLYKKVATFIGNGAQAEPLAADSSNIGSLIRTAYERIARTVTIDADVPSNIKTGFSAICGRNKNRTEGATCNNIEIGETVTFFANLEAESCDADQTVEFNIKTSFDNVKVKLELICECDCGPTEVDSSDCTDRGNLTCGKCFCDKEQFAGRFCQCTVEEAKNQTLCRVPGDSKVCSGQGVCDCGECRCNKPETLSNGYVKYYYGTKCECDNASCLTFEDKICGGPERGKCDCGVCKCNPQWIGKTCEQKCSPEKDQCFNPNDPSQTVCSGAGECKCNQCQCNEGAFGKYCEECVDEGCPDACRDFGECVKCSVFETSDLTPEECDIECRDKWNITSHVIVDDVEDFVPPNQKRCLGRDEDDCAFIFTYQRDNVTNEVKLFVQRDRICPAEPDILAIILGVIAGIVGIGLALLLIWKLLATIQDRREFAKFEKDLQNPKWDSGENPIYKKATSTFQNPMYGDKGAEASQSNAPLIE